jgi:hypothetical protein
MYGTADPVRQSQHESCRVRAWVVTPERLSAVLERDKELQAARSGTSDASASSACFQARHFLRFFRLPVPHRSRRQRRQRRYLQPHLLGHMALPWLRFEV